jgi:hypothetical protein
MSPSAVVKGAYGPQNQILSAAQAAAVLQQGGDINSIMAGWVDRGAWTYYDRILQPLAGTGNNGGVLYQTYSPFSVGINKPDAITGLNKTKWFTNMPNSGQFNPPRCLVLQRLGFYFEPTMLLADMLLFAGNAYFEMRIDEKIFFEGLLPFHPAGMGFSGAGTNQAQAVFTNGFPTPHATRSFGNYAKYIAPLQNFSLTITFPALIPISTGGTTPGGVPTLTVTGSGGAGLNVVVVMDGLTDRSVQ